MMHIVKESFNINIYNNVQIAFLHMLFGLSQSIFNAAIWTEAIARLTEFCFADWLHHLQDTLLNQPVHNRGNTEGTHFPISFGNFLAPDSLRLIPVKFSLYDLNQFRFTHFRQFRNRFAICPRRFAASVLFQISIC